MTNPLTPDAALMRLRQYEEQPAPTWSTASYGGGAAEGALAEIARSLAAEVGRLREERDRYRTSWRTARGRALSVGSAADRYAARARDAQEALQNTLLSTICSQLARTAAQKEAAELLGRVRELEQQLAEQRPDSRGAEAGASPGRGMPELSQRDRELLAGAAAGEIVAETAARVRRSAPRIYHLHGEIAREMGARSWIHAVALAAASGLITVPPARVGEAQ